MSHREQILRAVCINFYEDEEEKSAGDRAEDHL